MEDPHRGKPDLNAYPIVGLVRDAIVDATGSSLMGLYVYGSLATDDFEPDVSDIDLIAVLRDRPDETLVRQLGKMHESFARAQPAWRDRIEVDYVLARGLADCRTHATTIVRISPGEPLRLIEAGRDFLLDWYPARQDGVGLEGPRLGSLIPPIPEAEYLAEVRKYLVGFRNRFDEDASPGSQAYAILTMCRGLAALRAGDRLSKREAAVRIQQEFPRWADLIDRALAWRDQQWAADQPDGSATTAETRTFIAEMEGVLELS
ncbi:MAG TPA: aminoglycoside adenylyltransferase domain-containing protein [Actinomycetota bacterium]|nr:aminoglycoside adenylyltransferase domain-containing protein [Actinomycetota bacterium]